MSTAEEWGRVAVMLPGWRWMPGMLVVDTASNPAYRFTGRAWDDGGVVSDDGDGLNLECICRVEWPDPDDPATAGCLLRLLQVDPLEGFMCHILPPSSMVTEWRVYLKMSGGNHTGYGATLGRACIAAAEALGRWPGGAE
jgi:hypothetical protein